MRVVKGLRDTAVLEQHLKQTLQVRTLQAPWTCVPQKAFLPCCAAADLRAALVAFVSLIKFRGSEADGHNRNCELVPRGAAQAAVSWRKASLSGLQQFHSIANSAKSPDNRLPQMTTLPFCRRRSGWRRRWTSSTTSCSARRSRRLPRGPTGSASTRWMRVTGMWRCASPESPIIIAVIVSIEQCRAASSWPAVPISASLWRRQGSHNSHAGAWL